MMTVPLSPRQPLHVHRYGPSQGRQLLAIHGLTGHGARWAALATRHLPGVGVLAPDLIGHGRSSWAAPWTIDANVAALAALLEAENHGPVPVVGHSMGGAIALNLAAARPDLVASLVLLDPAAGIDGERSRQIADAMFASPDYTDRAEAREEKRSDSWADVAEADIEAELDEHLVELPNGRSNWRFSVPAAMSYWSELARDVAVPRAATPTTLVRATRVSPPYVTEALIHALRTQLGSYFSLVDIDCGHMVAQSRPAQTAAMITDRLGVG